MNTEITDIRNASDWVCFDAECALCRATVRRCGPLPLVYLLVAWKGGRL